MQRIKRWISGSAENVCSEATREAADVTAGQQLKVSLLSVPGHDRKPWNFGKVRVPWPDPCDVEEHADHLTLGLTYGAAKEVLAALNWPREYHRCDDVVTLPGEALAAVDLDATGQVQRLQDGSYAQQMGLKPADMLRSVNGQAYAAAVLESQMESAGHCTLTFHGKDHWITDSFGKRLLGKEVGYDLGVHLRTEFKHRNYDRFSVVKIPHFLKHCQAGQADCFLSHAQSEPVSTTLKAMKQCGRKARIFVDYFGLRQLQSDFKLPKVKRAIAAIGHTIMLLDPVMGVKEPSFAPEVLDRVFCIFEVVAMLEAQKQTNTKMKLSAVHTLRGYLECVPSVLEVNVEMAKSRNAKDKETIMNFIDELACDGMTGCEYANQHVSDAMRVVTIQAETQSIWWLLNASVLLVCRLAALFDYFVTLVLSAEIVVTFQLILAAKLSSQGGHRACPRLRSTCHVLWMLLSLLIGSVLYACLCFLLSLPVARYAGRAADDVSIRLFMCMLSLIFWMAWPVVAIIQHLVRVPLQLMVL